MLASETNKFLRGSRLPRKLARERGRSWNLAPWQDECGALSSRRRLPASASKAQRIQSSVKRCRLETIPRGPEGLEALEGQLATAQRRAEDAEAQRKLRKVLRESRNYSCSERNLKGQLLLFLGRQGSLPPRKPPHKPPWQAAARAAAQATASVEVQGSAAKARIGGDQPLSAASSFRRQR